MLAPDQRSVLRDLLRPPSGSTLEVAVCTSFTLDLDSALVAPLAFAAYDLEGTGDPIAVLEAVRAAAARVTIFSQAGYIRVPPTASDLMAFLEPMVHEVAAPNAGYLFHPKVWVLRYRDLHGDPSYRFICGTRNLTSDASWDAVVALDGVVESARLQASNRALADFVRALPDLAVRPVSAERRTAIDQLADELATVTWTSPEHVNEVSFHALGLNRRNAGPDLWSHMEGKRSVVLSPFLDDDTVNWLRDAVADLVIVSRIEELERLEPATVDGLECRILDPLAAIADEVADGGDEPTGSATALTPLVEQGVLGGLHAKVYVTEQRSQAHVVIGSSNATSAGLDDGNVEFVVALTGHRKSLGVDPLLDVDSGVGSLLREYVPKGGADREPTEDALWELENDLRSIATRPFRAEITAESGSWHEHVTTSTPVSVHADIRLTVGLLTVTGNVVRHDDGLIDAPFTLPAIADITPFVCLRMSRMLDERHLERSTIVRAELIGDPTGRLDEVLARQVNTPEKFLRFLMLLLTLGDSHQLPPSALGTGDGEPWFFGGIGTRGVFETILKALADRPAVIDDLDRLVERLRSTTAGAAVLPPGFDALWTSVLEARDALGATP